MHIAVIAVFIVLGFGSAASAQSLSGSDIQKSLKNKRVSLSCIDGTRGSGRYTMAANFGTITGRYQKPGGEEEADVGRVRADGSRLCLKFKLLNDGEERCFNVRSTGKGTFAFTAVAGLVDACQIAAL